MQTDATITRRNSRTATRDRGLVFGRVDQPLLTSKSTAV
jgi:hypothetical protein